jgi:putative molybdopterin biosynthesis protein
LRQQQFLAVCQESEAHERLKRLTAALAPKTERVPMGPALLGRVLADDVHTPCDVPAFDRSNVDGFALRASATFGADELDPRSLLLSLPAISAGDNPIGREVTADIAIPIATGAVIPRGADAVLMLEDSRVNGTKLELRRALAPGANISWAGTDMGRGELVLLFGTVLGSRETGLLAATGVAEVEVFQAPRVAIASTGDEIIAPGASLRVGQVYDSNSRIVADAVREAGGEPSFLGILPDDEDFIFSTLKAALTGPNAAQILILSGGTSKGAGDLNARVVERLAQETENSLGILVHGVALKPGKPICLAGVGEALVAVLPGFPTSAIFTFHEFLAPLIRRLSGRAENLAAVASAEMPLRYNSVAGRTEYFLVNLVRNARGLAAYPLGSGSGSVSTFSRADGFLRIPDQQEYLAEGEQVAVRLFSETLQTADLTFIGSHCLGLDKLVSLLRRKGRSAKLISVGSSAGLRALERGEADIAGTHLLHPETRRYNLDYLPKGCELRPGYRRRQGVVFRRGDPRFAGLGANPTAAELPLQEMRMVNRNPGSGTRVLMDLWLEGLQPPGYEVQARSHHAVAAAVAQSRADWGITLEALARAQGLDFLFLQDEHYDFAIRQDSAGRSALREFFEVLNSAAGQSVLKELGFLPKLEGSSGEPSNANSETLGGRPTAL